MRKSRQRNSQSRLPFFRKPKPNHNIDEFAAIVDFVICLRIFRGLIKTRTNDFDGRPTEFVVKTKSGTLLDVTLKTSSGGTGLAIIRFQQVRKVGFG